MPRMLFGCAIVGAALALGSCTTDNPADDGEGRSLSGEDSDAKISPVATAPTPTPAPLIMIAVDSLHPKYLELDREGNKLHRYADVLNLLAHMTGGQYFWVSDVEDVIRACGTITADLRHRFPGFFR